MSVLRLMFVTVTAISLVALSMIYVEAYSIGKLIGYVFLIPHLFFLGYLSFKAKYIPKGLGIFLIIASFSYVITIYGSYFLSGSLYDALFMIAMIPASLAEISLGIWLFFRAASVGNNIAKIN